MYPKSSKANNGKLRLLYECNPMAFLAEQANGKASDGFTRILDIEPKELHQRVPFICGSKNMVKKAEEFMRESQQNVVIVHSELVSESFNFMNIDEMLK